MPAAVERGRIRRQGAVRLRAWRDQTGRSGGLVPGASSRRGVRYWSLILVNLHVFSQGAGVCVGLVAEFAQIWLVRRVNVHVLLPVTAVGEASVAAFEFTQERFFSSVCPFVYFQILRTREHLATSREWAREGFLSRVHSDMIH